jgi:hypothetical protein
LSLKEDDLGIFKVEVFNEIGCSTFSDNIEITVGIKESTLNRTVEISPNPNNGTFKVSLQNVQSGNLKLEVIDLYGQVIYSTQFVSTGNNVLDVNLGNISTGSYMLRIITPEEIYIKKWIKN